MKPNVLAKIAMQVSEYFKKAYDLSQTNLALKQYDGGKFANILQYHSIYFGAMAYFVVAQDEFKTANEKAQGMGKVVGYFKRTAAEFERAKSIVALIPSNYQDNFNTKYADVIKLRDKVINENKTIYFEKEVPIE